MSGEQIQKALAGEIPIEGLSDADQEAVRAVQQLTQERLDELLADYRATKYTYRIEWAEDVRRWRAGCDQLHGLNYLATTPEGAIRGVIGLVEQIVKNGQERWWAEESQAREREVNEAIGRGRATSGEELVHDLDRVMEQGTDTDIRRTVPTDATVDWAKNDSFVTGTSTIYLVALPVHLDPGYDVVPDLHLGHFLDPHEAAIEARKRLEFQVANAPFEHRHNFVVSGAAVIPVPPSGRLSGRPLRPWAVRLTRKGTGAK